MFIAALFTKAKIWELLNILHTQARTHTHWNATQPYKGEILPFLTTWIDFESIVLSEISKRETNTVLFYLYVGSKNKTNCQA